LADFGWRCLHEGSALNSGVEPPHSMVAGAAGRLVPLGKRVEGEWKFIPKDAIASREGRQERKVEGKRLSVHAVSPFHLTGEGGQPAHSVSLARVASFA
jgi:hypothetical protein